MPGHPSLCSAQRLAPNGQVGGGVMGSLTEPQARLGLLTGSGCSAYCGGPGFTPGFSIHTPTLRPALPSSPPASPTPGSGPGSRGMWLSGLPACRCVEVGRPATSLPCAHCRGRGMASVPPWGIWGRGAERPPSESPQGAEEGAQVRGDPGQTSPPWHPHGCGAAWPGRRPLRSARQAEARGWGDLSGTWRWALARGAA